MTGSESDRAGAGMGRPSGVNAGPAGKPSSPPDTAEPGQGSQPHAEQEPERHAGPEPEAEPEPAPRSEPEPDSDPMETEGLGGLARLTAPVEMPRYEVLLARTGRFAFPLLLFATLLLWMALRYPGQFPQLALGLVTFIFTPVGKFTATWFISQGLGVWETIFILGTVDVIVGLFLVWNFGAIHQIPRFGPFLARLEGKGEALLQRNPWVRRFAFVGLAALVAIPVQGSGAIGGAIVGRILGLGAPRIIGAIALGGYTAVAAVAFASAGVGAVFRANAALGAALLILLAGITATGILAWKDHKKRHPPTPGP